jgi:hypothetical protein
MRKIIFKCVLSSCSANKNQDFTFKFSRLFGRLLDYCIAAGASPLKQSNGSKSQIRYPVLGKLPFKSN